MSRGSRAALLLVTFAVVLGAGAAHASVVGHYRFLTGSRVGWDLAYAALLSVTSYAVGLPDKTASRSGALAQALAAAVVAAIGISLIQFASGSLLLPRLVVITAAAVLTPVYVACAELSIRERSMSSRRDRVLVVAADVDVAQLVEDLRDQPEHAAQVVASAFPGQVRSRGSENRPLVELADSCGPTVLVLDRNAAADDSIVAQAAVLHERGVRVRTLSLFYEEWMGKLPLGELERVSLMFDIGELHRSRYGRVKRILDVAVAGVGTMLTGLLLPVVVVVDLAANRGPILFRQTRIGKGGQPFTILKFRTCQPDSQDASWTLPDDPRVTRGGAWLRRLHLDELPNCINILRGDMTLVGPRPEQPAYVEELSGKLPFYGLRHLVRPGLTGWAQVNYGYASDHLGALEKLQYDFYYLRRQSLPMDLRVLVRTIRTVIGSGR